jgi:hypothetical protein
VSVRCPTGAAGADVGAQVVLAMATRSGIPPLPAGRLRDDVRAALAACAGPVTIACEVGESGVTIGIDALPDCLAQMRAALGAHAPELTGGRLCIAVRRTQLRAV